MTRPTRTSSSSAAAASSDKKFDVFEFNEDDARVEKASERILGKFANPKRNRSSPITKYKFLQAFSQGPKSPLKNISSDPIDLDVEECEFTPESKSSREDVGNSGIDHQCTHVNSCSTGVFLQENGGKDESTGFDGFLESNCEIRNELHEVVSTEENCSQINSSSASPSTSSSAETEVSSEDQSMALGSSAFEINSMKMVVKVIPDFILYGDIYSTSSWLIFSCNSMKLGSSTANGSAGILKFEWPIDDIIKIESCWCGTVETAMINLLLKSEECREAGNTKQDPGFKQLKFAVYDPCWSKAEEAVKSLDVRYENIWNAISDVDTDNNENFSEFGQNSDVSWKHYFPIFDETMDEVIYPKGDPDAVSISMRDVELLQPETFINDTIIDFYIKHLKTRIPPDERNRFHFFNSFFFRKLADLDKDPTCACDGRAAFQRVRKWTRKVNLFEKDYIFVPINYSLHWSLIVICHPGELTYLQADKEIEESSKVPCILHMDSLRGSHKGLKNVFQSYLCEEWKVRHTDMVDDVSPKLLHMRFVSLELPQQENFYDCGLFLLHYVERFLEEAPIDFSPFKITKFSNFLTSKWFPPVEASMKRAHIQKLIYNIFQDSSQKAPSSDCIGKNPPSKVLGFVKHSADSSVGSCRPTLWGGDSVCSAKQGTDIQFPAASPASFPCFKEPGSFFKDLQGAVVNSSSANCQQVLGSHRRGFMSTIEEIEEANEEVAASPLVMEDNQVAVLVSDLSDFPSSSYFSKDIRASETSLIGNATNFIEPIEEHSGVSPGAPWNTLDGEAREDQPLDITEGSSYLSDKNDRLECCSSAPSEDLADCVVEDSQEANDTQNVDATVKSPTSLQENISPLTQNFDLSKIIDIEENDDSASESDEQEAKRRKLMEAGAERQITRRHLSKESCLISL